MASHCVQVSHKDRRISLHYSFEVTAIGERLNRGGGSSSATGEVSRTSKGEGASRAGVALRWAHLSLTLTWQSINLAVVVKPCLIGQNGINH